MGLFSRKKKISVSSVTVNLAGDNPKNFLHETITSAVLEGSDMASTISTSYLQGMGTKIRQVYRYGRDYYAYGLPSGFIWYGVTSSEGVQEVLEELNPGKVVTTLIIDFTVADLAYWIEQYLTQQYDWDEDYGGLGAPPPGVNADAEVTWSIDNNSKVTINMSNTPGTVTFTEDKIFTGILYTARYYHVIYRTHDSATPIVTTETRPYESGDVAGTTTNTNTVNDFGHVTQTVTTIVTTINSSSTETTIEKTVVVTTISRKQYFMYRSGSGTYPTLDAINNQTVRASTYYPVVPLRVNNVDKTNPNNVSANQFKTSTTLLNKMGLKFRDLGNKINENPDVGDIDHAFFVLGISLNSQYESSKDYLHEFFKYLAQISPSDKERYILWRNSFVEVDGTAQSTSPPPPVNNLSLKQDPYDISIAYQYAELTVKNGSIGPIGTVTRSTGPAASITIVSNNNNNNSIDLEGDVSVITFRKQISNTQYEEVEICGLEHTNYVYRGHNVAISGQASLSNPDNEGFLIPLCAHVVDAQQIVARTQMTYDCLHIVVNSYTVTKAKWYQTGIFKIVTIAIAVVIAIYSAGTLSAGIAAAAASATAAGTSVAAAVGTYIATQVAIGVAISMGVTFLASQINPNLAIFAAVAMLAYGAVSAYQSYGDPSAEGLPYASEVMSMVPAVSKGAETRLEKDLQGVVKQMQEQAENYKKQMQEIEDAMDALGNPNPNIDIDGLMNAAFFNLFEQPDEFFARTLNMNPGTVTLDSISGYADYALTLPTDLNSLRS